MVLALSEPARVRRLIVADIAPVAYAHSQLALRPRDAGGRPRRGQPPRRGRRRAGGAACPSRACAPSSCRASRSAPDGAAWKLNLAALAEQMPRIMGFPDLAGPLRRPDAVPDRRDLRLRPRPSTGRASARSSRPPRHVEIPGAGHWLHADAPAAFVAAVADFLDAGLTATGRPSAAVAKGSARRSSSAGRARHS